MNSYLKGDLRLLLQEARFRLKALGNEDSSVREHILRMRDADRHLAEYAGVTWKSCRLLDLGCGQLLRNALYFAQDNEVVGIDTEPPWQAPYVGDAWRTLRECGALRAVKTGVRMGLGVDVRFRRAYARALGRRLEKPQVLWMNGKDLRFADESFDGAFSFSVLQHVDEPRAALLELRRVLRDGAWVYLNLHLYTSLEGSDHPQLRTATGVDPWAHLRPGHPLFGVDGLFCNRLRLGEWQELVRSVFTEVHFPVVQDERVAARELLTDPLRAELAEYEEEELTTSTFIAVARR